MKSFEFLRVNHHVSHDKTGKCFENNSGDFKYCTLL